MTRRAATGFCWTDASSGRYYLARYEDGPWITPDRKRAFADATLGNYTPLGCVGHTHDRPTITYDGFGNRRAR